MLVHGYVHSAYSTVSAKQNIHQAVSAAWLAVVPEA